MPRAEDDQVYQRHKRAPIRPPTTETDLYLTRKSVPEAQLKRIHKLFKDGKESVTLHGLGAAICKAVKTAYMFKREHPEVQWDIWTSTVELYDDLEPKELDDEPTVQVRNNTAIHIKINNPK